MIENNILGVILAGGKSSRFGSNKADAHLGDKTLLEHTISKVEKISESEIIKKYDNKFKVIPKNMMKYFSDKILKLNNLSIVDLDHNELEFLKLKGLLNEDLIKPLYLS